MNLGKDWTCKSQHLPAYLSEEEHEEAQAEQNCFNQAPDLKPKVRSPDSAPSLPPTRCVTVTCYCCILLILWVPFLHATANQHRSGSPERKHGSPSLTHLACCVKSKIRTCGPILGPAGVTPRFSHTCERHHLVVGLAAFRKYSL